MLSDKIIDFNKSLEFKSELPQGIDVMNPFRNNPEALATSEQFYKKFYSDDSSRKIILGINPGRLGAGVTGIPFTDSKRLAEYCKIDSSLVTHEPSSVFVYDVIRQYGGAEKFYSDFYINSVCPLGFIEEHESGNWNNLNYYDYPFLFKIARPFIIEQLKKQVEMGIDTSTAYVLGKKNAKYFELINNEHQLFRSVEVLEHPRYIEQYKSKTRSEYIAKYIRVLTR